ncbi:unnamed protein product [Calicophoron daubneyi]|uniref:Uncharacterized protein n=1 Tax=Calicophoron daubneyi TaxID=300641 RepID=A0AAV2TYG7_CALDB
MKGWLSNKLELKSGSTEESMVSNEGAYRFTLNTADAYDESLRLVTLTHRLIKISIGVGGTEYKEEAEVSDYGLIELTGTPHNALEKGEFQFNCYVRPPTIGHYILYIYAKVNKPCASQTDSKPEIIQCEQSGGENEKPAGVFIGSVALDPICALCFYAIQCHVIPKPFPPAISSVWGSLCPELSAHEGEMCDGCKMGSQTAAVEHLERGVIVLTWNKLPVFYEITVNRADERTKVRLVQRRPVKTVDQGTYPAIDPFPVVDEEEDECKIGFTMRFAIYGEHTVEVYASRNEIQTRRTYELIGQYLFDIRPKNDDMCEARSLTDSPVVASFVATQGNSE